MKLLSKEQFAVVENEAEGLIKPAEEFAAALGIPNLQNLGKTVCMAIDQAAPRLDIPGKGSSSSAPTVAKQETAVCEPDVNVTISMLQSFFAKDGISIALCGESHRYKDPPPVEPKLARGQGMLLQAMLDNDTDGWTPREFEQAQQEQLKFAEFAQQRRTFNSDLITYRKSQFDCIRAKKLLANSTGGEMFPKVDLVVLERAMKLYTEGDRSLTVKEDELLTKGWGIRQRSALMAAYIFLCAAAGGDGRVLVMFGEEHKDIFDFFEYFATHSRMFTGVSQIRRNYCLVESHVK